MKRDKLEDLFKNKLSDYESDELIPAWEEIEHKLSFPVQGKSVSFFRRYSWAAAAIAGVAFTGSYFLFQQDVDHSSEVFAESVSNESFTGQTAPAPQPSLEVKVDPIPASVGPAGRSFIALLENDAKQMPGHQSVSHNVNDTDLRPIKDVSEHDQKQELPDAGAKGRSVVESVVKTPGAAGNYAYSDYGKKQKRKQHAGKDSRDLSIALLASNFSMDDGIDGRTQVLSLKSPEDGALEEPSKVSARTADPTYSHRLPVTLGVNVGVKLPYKLSLETGLTYTYLYSEYKIPQNYVTKGTQSLYYLGIPVNLAYDIAEWKSLRFYAAAGTRLDINLKAKQKSYQLNEEYPHSFRDKKPVWSLRAKAGVAIKVLDWLQIYGEPGVAHYFYNGDIRSYWSDNTLTFDLNFGLRAFL